MASRPLSRGVPVSLFVILAVFLFFRPTLQAEGGGEGECLERALSFLDECEELDGEGCERRAVELKEACINEDCTPIPPSEPRCEDLCLVRAEEAFSACREDDGSIDECEGRSGAELEECLVADCEPPPPPPPPPFCEDPPPPGPTCKDKCEAEAGMAFRACLEENGDDFEEECRERSLAIFNQCVDENCGDDEPPPPSCVLGHVFLGRRAPPEPYTRKGQDPTGDLLVCRGLPDEE